MRIIFALLIPTGLLAQSNLSSPTTVLQPAGGGGTQIALQDGSTTPNTITFQTPGSIAGIGSYVLQLPSTLPLTNQFLQASSIAGNTVTLSWATGGGGGSFLPLSGGTMVGNILFGADNTYNIGQSGTAPANIYTNNLVLASNILPSSGSNAGLPGSPFAAVNAVNMTSTGLLTVQNATCLGTCTGFGSGGGGANTALSNLTPTSVNQNLIPRTSGLSLGGAPSVQLWGQAHIQSAYIGGFNLGDLVSGQIRVANGINATAFVMLGTVPTPGGLGGYVTGISIGPGFGASAIIPAGGVVDIGTANAPMSDFYGLNYFANGSAGVTGSGCSAFTSGICTSLGGGGSGANTALSNLAATSINASLVPNSNNTLNLGAPGVAWANAYIEAVVSNSMSANAYFSSGSPGVTSTTCSQWTNGICTAP